MFLYIFRASGKILLITKCHVTTLKLYINPTWKQLFSFSKKHPVRSLVTFFYNLNKMPENSFRMNGHCNGTKGFMENEIEDGCSFLFTSESVGEGHPGKYLFCLVPSTILSKFFRFDLKTCARCSL